MSAPPAKPQIIIFNKPFNVLSQFTDAEREAQSRQNLSDFLHAPGVYPAGRLDRDSEGLLVLTDDGKLKHRLTRPGSTNAGKEYWVQVEGLPTDVQLQQVREGVELRDGLTRPAKCRAIDEPPALWPRDPPIRFRKNKPTTWLSLTLYEGKNRQVRRMCAAVGLPVLRLVRYRVASWTIDGLMPGEWLQIQ